ncbi:GbsR/MarR family transcriptional regulator [uncultured Demequina sp.]|uniref:GbsR/MarR family transcriptional regulator n=1 Tax=uncultured Demequina sp. TaxID=693499 RepID=UPI0025EC17E4|nr:MarR family transcriptional regulator [uncultured Demequina sp.]
MTIDWTRASAAGSPGHGGDAPAASGAAAPQRADARAQYAAQVAQYWETVGFSPAAGAILGHLMVCEPAAQTQAELAEALHLSAGTVSTQLRSLIATTLVEKVRLPGQRALRYQLPQNVWLRLIGSETERIAGLRRLVDAAAEVSPETRPDRIGALDTVVRFFEAEWPAFMARYDDYLRKEGS